MTCTFFMIQLVTLTHSLLWPLRTQRLTDLMKILKGQSAHSISLVATAQFDNFKEHYRVRLRQCSSLPIPSNNNFSILHIYIYVILHIVGLFYIHIGTLKIAQLIRKLGWNLLVLMVLFQNVSFLSWDLLEDITAYFI